MKKVTQGEAKKAAPKTVTEKQHKPTTAMVVRQDRTAVIIEKPNKRKLLYVASECLPYIATGGLADVAGSLPKVLATDTNYDVRVVLPMYSGIKQELREQFEFVGFFYTHLSWRREYCGVFKQVKDNVTYYFLDNEKYFKRDKAYGYMDDGERFAFFSKAVVDFTKFINFQPDIIHCNDWQSAMVPVYIRTLYAGDAYFAKTRLVYTIHNIAYQGQYDMYILGDLFGLDNRYIGLMDYDGCINLTKAAIEVCDMFSTVSPSYAEEIKGEFGKGLQHVINKNAHKLCGILNGIDYDFYNPKTDKILVKNYDINNAVPGKALNKLEIQKRFGLTPLTSMPLVAIISRLVSHKGLDLVKNVIERALVDNRMQLVVFGLGDAEYANYFKYLENKYKGKVRAITDMFDNGLARKVYAAADIFLMPSHFEPCGLAQMICSRFGTIPIVRETGGLKDSIKDFGYGESGNGYTFARYNAEDLLYSINRAITDFYKPDLWEKQIARVMKEDFSWEKSVAEYKKMYDRVLSK